ncbi:vitamin D3 hydroxylase-associated protein [Protobothrops mucrosquamatus]|uniref:vitamin D3 hydroxylase-associated protein n=1 Tax=Protobothrops mucrosquamatus TaxID=103944 RepID=UPI0007758B4C|nr:vitamin D3 hydroxylase-associated protein [Protobothrops mucrosquamatus]XP_015668042.1 vitamin D3 hydroxylase-associated protein [Protobothrops mucrosquamatus]
MLQEAPTIFQEWLKQSWPQDKTHLYTAVILTCGTTAFYFVLKWLGQKRIKKQIEETRRQRDRGLIEMEKSVQAFKSQNPGIPTGDILSLPLVELVQKLKEDTLSPDVVLYTYMEKALTVTKEVNCVRHFIPECEPFLQQLKKQEEKGLLYGVPISIKDHIGYKGHLTTCGFSHFLDVEGEDSVLVKVLKKQGANPFVFTNVPQSLFNYDCSNVVFGQTVNPLDHKRTPGGSSGGEGALIAGGGSVLGFGSDVGGSIRLPSSFCGLCGLKPTTGRLSVSGVKEPFHLMLILGTIGPMAKDVDSLALCMRAVLCDYMFQLDPTVPPIPFNQEIYSSSTPLRIGYYDTDGYFLLPPCMRRAVHETRKLLQEAGHTLVPFDPSSVDYVIDEIYVKGAFADGGSSLLALFQKDIVDPALKAQVKMLAIPKLVKKVLAKFTKSWFPRLAGQLNALCGVRNVKDMWKIDNELMVYRKKFIEHWRKNKLDVVLCPVLGPAFFLGYPSKILGAISSTMLYNALNFPAGVVPVTTVTEADEEEMAQYQGLYGDSWDRTLKKAVEGAVGLPVAVQCVALPWQEELCLRFMKEVEMLSNKEQQKKFI